MIPIYETWGDDDDSGKTILVGYRISPDKRQGLRDAKDTLIKEAGKLLWGLPSEFPEDWPKTTPRSVLREITRHNERLRMLAIEMRRIADSI